jgi:PEP-CTERM motif
VPEPSSAILGLISVGLLAARWRCKKRRHQEAA